ncbi:MAG: hypothetical protein Q7T26_04275 [Dehalococcoidia bacterium]|nr:hypothetical protein [Dehalococcoidia bacterium]
MKNLATFPKRHLPMAGFNLALSGLIVLAAACTPGVSSASPAPPRSAPVAAPAAAKQMEQPRAPEAVAAVAPRQPAPAAAPAAAALPKPLNVNPVKGSVGQPFSISAEGLPASKEVQFFWATASARYDMEPSQETIEFYEAKWTEKRVPVGRAVTDGQGKLSANLVAPDGYGGVHDVYGVVDGQDVTRGGFRVLPEFTVTPTQGPIGTPITIKGKGIGWRPYENTWVLTYDNQFTGFISTVTTGGQATAAIRASGPPGKHVIELWHGHKSVPYLNWEQAPVGHTPTFQFTFTVTEDPGVPATSLDGPEPGVVKLNFSAIRTTASETPINSGARATITPSTGPVLSNATLRVTGLTANTPTEVFFMTARGSRVSGRGWALAELSLGTAKSDNQGALTLDFQVPDDLGGWHTLKVVQGDKVVAEPFFYVQQSLVEVTPSRVKVGEMFQVHVKGIGWTELDNTFTLTYDNSYIGYACGFNSKGDVVINMRATGQPGTHLIDLYPTVYQGHGKPPFMYQTPQLTALQDHPSLEYGYQLPIFRLAIEVVP